MFVPRQHYPRELKIAVMRAKELDAERIAQLEREIGQRVMEIDFKKTLRRFKQQLLPIVSNGIVASTSKSAKPRKRRQQ